MECHWLKNKETGKTLFISESQFEVFGIDLKDKKCPWEKTKAPEKKVDKKILNKPTPAKTIIIEKDGKKIRAGETQLDAFKNQGWKVSEDQSIAEPKPKPDEKEEVKDSTEDQISENEIITFLGGLSPDNPDLWNEDGTVKQSVVDNVFGEGKITQEDINVAWEGFTKETFNQ